MEGKSISSRISDQIILEIELGSGTLLYSPRIRLISAEKLTKLRKFLESVQQDLCLFPSEYL